MAGLIRHAQGVAGKSVPTELKDAALLAAVQKISHDGLADYRTALAYARAMNRRDIANILTLSHKEKKEAIAEMYDMAKHEIIPHVRKAGGAKPSQDRKPRERIQRRFRRRQSGRSASAASR